MIISTPPVVDPSGQVLLDEGEDAAATEAETRVCALEVRHHGYRLDRALVDVVPELSRSYLQQLIDSGHVTLNGKPAGKASAKVRTGDRLTVLLQPTLQSQAFKAEVMHLAIVHEDAHLLVLNKPAGMVVHPAAGNWSGTLLNGLLGRDPQAATLPRAGIVHRLDKDTSGLMVVARTRAAMDRLVQLIAAREVHREYLALAHNSWRGPVQRRVDAAIGRDPRQRLRMAVVDLNHQPGKTASTDFELLENGEAVCLLRCTLHTGRTHQIRVHAASLKHPLVADVLYGGAVQHGLQRQALHARRLAFVHPISGQPMAFEAGLPADLQAALSANGLRYNPVSEP